MRIVYVIAAHQLPEQLARLVQRLADGYNPVLVHVDRRTAKPVFEEMVRRCAGYPLVSFMRPRRTIHWADFSQVEVQLAGIRAARERYPDLRYVAILSGQCYPLLATAELETRLTALSGASWIDSHPMPSPEWSNGMEFLQDWHFRVGKRWIVSRTVNGRRHHKIMNVVFPRRPIPKGLTPYKGSAYFLLEREACDYVLDFTERRPDIARYFKFSFAADEMFIQSILGGSQLPLLRERTHYIRFSNDNLNPDTLTLRDLDIMRKSGKVFARKFDMRVDRRPLDALDAVAAIPAPFA